MNDIKTKNELSIITQNKLPSFNENSSEEECRSIIQNNPNDYQTKYRLAKLLHEKGEKKEAYQIFQEVLEKNQNTPVVFEIIKVLISDNQNQAALNLLEQLLNAQISNPSFYLQVADIYNKLNLPQKSIEICKKTIQLLKNIPDSSASKKQLNHDLCTHLAFTYGILNDYQKSIDLCDQALKIYPDNLKLFIQSVRYMISGGKYQEALNRLNFISQKSPNNPDVLTLKGVTHIKLGQNKNAIYFFKEAIKYNSNDLNAYNFLIDLLGANENFDEALTYVNELILKDNSYNNYFKKAKILMGLNKIDEGIKTAKKLVEIDPHNDNSWNALSAFSIYKGKYEDCLRYLEKAIDLNPKNENAHFNHSLLLLRLEKLEEGFRENEWRLVNPQASKEIQFKNRTWSGEKLGEKTLLIGHEQGLGDFIFLSRYFKKIIKDNPKANICCMTQNELETFAKNNFPEINFITAKKTIPPFHYVTPSFSLPLIFKTNISNIPHPEGYLTANSDLLQEWKIKINNSLTKKNQKKLKVGICWSGNPKHANDKARSINIKELTPILNVSNCVFFNLQIGDKAKELKNINKGKYNDRVVDFTNEIKDFNTSSAIIKNLDLIISVDTALVHLAGSLNIPTWMFLPVFSDWRWFLNRTDCPWYNSVTIYRQKTYMNWSNTIKEVTENLKNYQQ